MMPVRKGNVPASTPALDQPIPLSRLETTTATPKLPVRIAVASSRARRDIIRGSGQAMHSGRLRRTCFPSVLRRPGLVRNRTGAGTTEGFEACATSLDQPALLARDLLDALEVLLDELVELVPGQERVDLGALLDVVLPLRRRLHLLHQVDIERG